MKKADGIVMLEIPSNVPGMFIHPTYYIQTGSTNA